VLVQISSDAQENCPGTGNGGDFVDVLQAFGRFDCGDGQTCCSKSLPSQTFYSKCCEKVQIRL
jgi:hypothetical protein